MEAGADAGAGPEGGIVLRVEDLDRALLSDPVAHLGKKLSFKGTEGCSINQVFV